MTDDRLRDAALLAIWRLDTGLTYECRGCGFRWKYEDEPKHADGCVLMELRAALDMEAHERREAPHD